MKVSKILKNTLSLFSAQIYTKFTAAVFFIIAARTLGTEGFGSYVLVLTFISFFYILSDWGLSTLTIRDVARSHDKTKEYLAETIPVRIILAVIFYLLLIGLAFMLSYPRQIIMLIGIAGTSLFTNTILGAFNAIFSAHEKMHIPSMLGMIFSTLFVIAGGVCLYLKFGLISLMSLLVILNLANTLLSAFLLRKVLFSIRFSLNPAAFKKLISQSSPYAMLSALSIIYFRIDTVILSKMQTIDTVGIYNAAYKIVDFLMFIPVCYMGACFPQMSRQLKLEKDKLKDNYFLITKNLLFIILPIAVVCTLFAKDIISALFGKSFLPSASALRILIWAVVVMYINAPLGNIVYSSDKLTRFVPFAVLNTLLNIVLNIILIPKWSYIGASWTTLITEITGFILQIWLIKKFIFK